jgi:hypothetical protein
MQFGYIAILYFTIKTNKKKAQIKWIDINFISESYNSYSSFIHQYNRFYNRWAAKFLG